MSINKAFFLFVLILLVLAIPNVIKGQDKTMPATNVENVESDSALIKSDSISIKSDTAKTKPAAIEAPVEYQSRDSIVMLGTNLIYLFGDGNVKYMDLDLTAERIEVNSDSSQVYASYALDSVGDEFGYPVFKEGESQYEAKTMRYNFKTKKGFITDVVTQQGEGYVTGGKTKKMANNDLCMVDGRYTTCDNHDHPHFYLALTKGKIKPGKDVVSGPAYLVVEDVPLPIALPFAFFPFSKPYSSGIIMPTYGDEMSKGFCLRDGGYYFAFSDYIDLALTGEIYTKGSWGLTALSSYTKRYKYSGRFETSYKATILEDYESKDFRLSWSHSQDPKANPYLRVSANVDFVTNSYDQNQATTDYSGRYTSNTKASSVNITKTFPNSSLTLGATMSVNQQTRDSVTSVTLPSLTISYGQTYPFKRKNSIGDPKWYEQIYFSYQSKLQNSITTKDSLLFHSSLKKDWKNSMSHSIPISASFSAFKYLNISPSISFNSDWYSRRVIQEYNDTTGRLTPVGTEYGFYMVNRYSASLSLNTKLYGFYTPWKIFGDKVKTIRHVITPRVSFTGAPDFGDRRYGYYNEVNVHDGLSGNYNPMYYTPFESAPSRGKTGAVSFGFDNNIEMKVKSDADSTGEKKISIIDNLGLGMSYNFLDKELPWSDLTANLRLKITKSYTFNIGAIFDTYAYDEFGKPTKPRWEVGKGFPRLKSTGSSFSYSFSNEWMDKLLNGEDDDSGEQDDTELDTDEESSTELEEDGAEPEKELLRGKKEDVGEFDSNGYLVNKIPWNLSFNLGLNVDYDYANFNRQTKEYGYLISKTFGFSGNITPTKGWSFNFNADYDFEVKKIVRMDCSIVRDLHCWQMSANIIPLGPYQSYMFTIAVKSSLLQDLKLNKSSNYRDAVDWD